jgi:hypothetical protein
MGDIASFIAALLALVALVSGYVKFLLPRSLLPCI